MPRRSKRDIFDQASPTVRKLIAALRKSKETEQADAVQAVLTLAEGAVRATEAQAALDANLNESFSIPVEFTLYNRAYENSSNVSEDVLHIWETFLAGEWEPVRPVRAAHGSAVAKSNVSVRAPKELIQRVEAAADQMVADKGWPTTRGYKLNARQVAAQGLALKYPAAPESEAAAESRPRAGRAQNPRSPGRRHITHHPIGDLMAPATQAAASAGGPTSYIQNLADGLDFEDAVRAAEKARIALTGPSGSGKTYTALSIGTGLLPEGGTLGVIDTERGSASKYAGLFTFKTMKLPSFEPQALIRALAVAAARGIDVIIIDSLTHFWSGRGGALAQVDQKTKASSSKNAFTTGWKDVSPVLLDMLDAILSYPGHVICTMRVKVEWALQENQNGKKEPTKLGTKLDQREGIDYEFDMVGALNQQHVMTIDKSRYPTIEVGSAYEKPDFGFGHTIAEWLDDGEGNPLGVMDYLRMALDPEMKPQQLLDLLTEVEGRGLLGAAVLGLDRQATSLGDLIKLMGSAARVKDPATDPEGVRALRMRLEQSGRLGSMVPGMDGQPTAIGDLIAFTQNARRQAKTPEGAAA